MFAGTRRDPVAGLLTLSTVTTPASGCVNWKNSAVLVLVWWINADSQPAQGRLPHALACSID